MPHVIVKFLAGRSDEQKLEIARQFTETLVNVAITKPGNVSVAFEDIAGEDWNEAVNIPYIYGRSETVYKWPDYLEKK